MARFCDDDYGRAYRSQFGKAADGSGELAMLITPSKDELAELQRAVAIMTPDEKSGAADLTDEQVRRIADDAKVDPANLAIFINGYAIHCKRVS